MREDVDDAAVGVLDEESPDAPRFVGERVDDAQAPVLHAGVQLINGFGAADVDPEVGLRDLEAAGADVDLRG